MGPADTAERDGLSDRVVGEAECVESPAGMLEGVRKAVLLRSQFGHPDAGIRLAAEIADCREGLQGFPVTGFGLIQGLTAVQAVAYARRARGSRKRPTTGWDSLTPTELQVVELAAQGFTNPEIGRRLFIGAGTVKTHLSHVFAKLNVSSRTELAAAASRRG